MAGLDQGHGALDRHTVAGEVGAVELVVEFGQRRTRRQIIIRARRAVIAEFVRVSCHSLRR